MKVSCPICGSKRLKRYTAKRVIGDRLLGTEEITEILYKCSGCKESGDFSNVNDGIYDKAEWKLFKKAVPVMLDDIRGRGMNMAEFERAYGLPQRTTARWRRGELSQAAVVLIKLTLLYPDLPYRYEKSI